MGESDEMKVASEKLTVHERLWQSRIIKLAKNLLETHQKLI